MFYTLQHHATSIIFCNYLTLYVVIYYILFFLFWKLLTIFLYICCFKCCLPMSGFTQEKHFLSVLNLTM
ncbi:hypothetical protein EB796_007693 [Bugula neritina]|uniref:Uncharacterized protein n=1 Tax=Bugula neritina TaxID=10212 RepID=A0A7J7K8Q0_BUGNE|nr:hypothetical protein EB796_007693 [Bugula neritina]